jgi:GDP-L-fucose synthase
MAISANASIYVAGHRGMVGSAIVRLLEKRGFKNIITRTRQELNLRDKAAVQKFYAQSRPEYVVDAAAKVGGIIANASSPVEFLVENLEIQNNLIVGAYEAGVKKLLFLGSSCIYPRMAPQPMDESVLLTGPLEPTNISYALAKISGIQLCRAYRQQYKADFISAMPTNLYGINDNFDLTSSHVLPALIRRFHEAKAKNDPSVTLWGTGTPKREFLYVDDLAEACLFLLENYSGDEHVNVGRGEDISIADLAELIKKIVGFGGEIKWDTSKPDGMPRKLLNVSKINKMGWKARTGLEEGIRLSYEWWLKNGNPAGRT